MQNIYKFQKYEKTQSLNLFENKFSIKFWYQIKAY